MTEKGWLSIVAVNLVWPSSPHLPWADVFENYLLHQRIEFVVLDRVAQGLLTPPQMEFFDQKFALVQQYDYGRGRWVKIYKQSPHG